VVICVVAFFVVTSPRYGIIFTTYLPRVKNWAKIINASAPLDWHRPVDDGRWYDFSHKPLFAFYVYSAFFLDHGPQAQVRLISISSPLEHFASRHLKILCVVRRSDENTSHVASILHPPPRQLSRFFGVSGYRVTDYVYRCPLPQHRQGYIPVRIRKYCSAKSSTMLSWPHVFSDRVVTDSSA